MTSTEHQPAAPDSPDGWGTDVLEYTLIHEAWFGPSAGYHHPALHLARIPDHREGAVWEMEVTEQRFPARRGGPDLSGVKLHAYIEDAPVLVADLPAQFWDGVRSLNTVAELARLLDSVGGRDVTPRQRPPRAALAEAVAR